MVTARLFGIGLVLRRGIGEGGQGFRRRLRDQQAWKLFDRDAEAACIAELRYEADVGERRCRAKAEWTWLAREQLLACSETFFVGPRRPRRDIVFGEVQRAE